MVWLSVAGIAGCVGSELEPRRAPLDAGSPRGDAAPFDDDAWIRTPDDAWMADARDADRPADATVESGPPLSIVTLPGERCRDLAVAHPAPDMLFGFAVTGRPSSVVEIWASRPSCGVAPFVFDEVTLDATGYGSLARSTTGSASCDDRLLGSWTAWAVQDGARSDAVELTFRSSACSLDCAAATTFCPAPPVHTCDPLVFTWDGPFTPTAAEPVRRRDFDVDDGLVFGRIDVELDVVRGAWASDHAEGTFGMHNVFWLHRGLRGQGWLDNCVGYVNFTAASRLRAESNLGITEGSGLWSDVLSASGAATAEGARHHVSYSYDAEEGRWWLRLSDAAGTSLAYGEGVARVDHIDGRSPYPHGSSAFFLEIGHVPWTAGHDGPEVATLGWTYSAVEVRFYPLGDSCP